MRSRHPWDGPRSQRPCSTSLFPPPSVPPPVGVHGGRGGDGAAAGERRAAAAGGRGGWRARHRRRRSAAAAWDSLVAGPPYAYRRRAKVCVGCVSDLTAVFVAPQVQPAPSAAAAPAPAPPYRGDDAGPARRWRQAPARRCGVAIGRVVHLAVDAVGRLTRHTLFNRAVAAIDIGVGNATTAARARARPRLALHSASVKLLQ